MADNTRLYELLAADHSPVALLVLSGDGSLVRHVNHTMARLLGLDPETLIGRSLTEIAPALDTALRSSIETVAKRGRPSRTPGCTLPFPNADDRAATWDVACSPLPSDSAFTPPELVAVWLWPEDTGAAASRRVVEALRLAQQEAVPAGMPGFEIAAMLVPSEPGAALGGDTFDVISLGSERWAILIADVSGRGPAAAARAIMVRHSVRVLAAHHSPGAVFSQLSRLMLADPSFTGFVTAFLGIIDTGASTLTYVVAGHEPTLILRGMTGDVEELTGDGAFPLAVDDSIEYEERITPLSRHDILVLYTDGLTDTRRDAEFYDAERLRTALLRHRQLPAPALAATLLSEAEEWASSSHLRDDTAVLIVRGQEAG